jgi:phosphoglucomutase
VREKIDGILTAALGTGGATDSVKVNTENGWFTARTAGTEDVHKNKAESFQGGTHLRLIKKEIRALMTTVLRSTS